jgi:hypothetical protein
MSTVNGVGTMRYDWAHLPDGTAEATLWFVVGFFPLIPLKRQRLQVVSDRAQPSTIAKAAMATTAYGEGFRSEMMVLGNAPMNPARVLRTYFYGWIVTPLLAFILPLLIGLTAVWALERCVVDPSKYMDYVTISFGIGGVVWAAIVVAKILDRAAGRQTGHPRKQDGYLKQKPPA